MGDSWKFPQHGEGRLQGLLKSSSNFQRIYLLFLSETLKTQKSVCADFNVMIFCIIINPLTARVLGGTTDV